MVDIATDFLGNFLFFTESVMNIENVCSCCQQALDVKQASEISKACKIYRIILNITNAGCDAEVKKVKGELKILSVKKSLASDFGTIN